MECTVVPWGGGGVLNANEYEAPCGGDGSVDLLGGADCFSEAACLLIELSCTNGVECFFPLARPPLLSDRVANTRARTQSLQVDAIQIRGRNMRCTGGSRPEHEGEVVEGSTHALTRAPTRGPGHRRCGHASTTTSTMVQLAALHSVCCPLPSYILWAPLLSCTLLTG